ncbi:MAG: amidohydrolase [Oceanospirillum sp.]|nr:amidohydrolase [Oceanospirillum sp.]
MNKKFISASSILICILLVKMSWANSIADRVFYGDNIVTMDKGNEGATAVAIREDTILYVGNREGVKSFISEDTNIVELGEKSLIPGLIDSHGHVTFSARLSDFVNASSPPVGPSQNIQSILDLLKARLASNPPKDGGWLMAYGYDDSLLEENRHPTRDDLDKVSTTVPIYMMHVSGHLGAANSAALKVSKVDSNTPNPPGGVFRRYEGTTEPNGVLEEAAASALLYRYLGANSQPEKFAQQMETAINYFATFGITTIQDGAAQLRDVAAIKKMAEEGRINTDIAMVPIMHNLNVEQIAQLTKDGYYQGARVAGVKFVLDGSPQGRTAWTTQPYKENPDGVTGPYTAYPTVNIPLFKKQAKSFLDAKVPIYLHANGDAAIDLAMDAVEEAFEGKEIPDHRSVIIHSQVMRPDQVERAAQLKMVPSFYSAHSFFWGDWHRKSFGDERAFHISPAESARKKGVHFTIHNDTPIVPPDMMRLMWIAVNRKTRSGFILGPDERLSPYDALYAMTMGGAYQYFEEDKKGSLSVGKQADMVILERNPLKVDADKIKDIAILETIAHGKTTFLK